LSDLNLAEKRDVTRHGCDLPACWCGD